MIALLRGIVVEHEGRAVVIDVGGVGYRVSVSSAVLADVSLGQEATLRIYHHITSDHEALYGFLQKEELQFFELLLTVPSVGPKTALNILDVAPPKVLAQAVARGDVKLLTKVSGVGRKTADRILVELKSKFKDLPITGLVSDVHEETLSVLINMGFSKAQARESVQNLPDKIESVEAAVKHVLQRK